MLCSYNQGKGELVDGGSFTTEVQLVTQAGCSQTVGGDIEASAEY